MLYALFSGYISVVIDVGVRSTVSYSVSSSFLFDDLSLPLLSILPRVWSPADWLIHSLSFFFPGRGMSASTANQEPFLWCLRSRSMLWLWSNSQSWRREESCHQEMRWSPRSHPHGTCSDCFNWKVKVYWLWEGQVTQTVNRYKQQIHFPQDPQPPRQFNKLRSDLVTTCNS